MWGDPVRGVAGVAGVTVFVSQLILLKLILLHAFFAAFALCVTGQKGVTKISGGFDASCGCHRDQATVGQAITRVNHRVEVFGK